MGSGSEEASFEARPGYRLFVTCDDVSVQVSGGLGRSSVSYGSRAAVPCRAGTIEGPLGGEVRTGETIFLKVVAPAEVGGRLVASAD